MPPAGWALPDFRELWRYRELLLYLTWRDVRLRYRQTALGVLWAVFQPLLTTVVFTFFFGRLAGIGSDGVPYPVFALSALLPWTLFSQALVRSSNSLVSSAALLKKVYFPRLIIPLAACMGPLVDFTITFALMIGAMIVYGIPFGPGLLLLPPLILLVLVLSIGVGLWLSALSVRYRDFIHIAPFFIQIWLFVTPVIYPTSRMIKFLDSHGIPEWVGGLNPMAGVVEGFRAALLGLPNPSLPMIAASIVIACVFMVTGMLYFRRTEWTFADLA
ncbi:MAG TPA: ABC transporter permease [Kofleriaceae bacterium]|nr:ABC transporter permease [Kofleriaceae bacterium]